MVRTPRIGFKDFVSLTFLASLLYLGLLLASLISDGLEIEGASCTQRKVYMVPFVFSIPFVLRWGGSISSDSFLPSILLLVVIIVMVVIVVVILIVIVVAIVGVVVVVVGVSSILKLSFVIIGLAYAFHQDKASSVRVLVANVTLSSLAHLLRENTDSNQPVLPKLQQYYQQSVAGWQPESMPTAKDGDTGMGDSTGVSVSLVGEISSGGKKSQE
ncbi:hypothetical protein Tco_0085121 [Tanacetum coccineum]